MTFDSYESKYVQKNDCKAIYSSNFYPYFLILNNKYRYCTIELQCEVPACPSNTKQINTTLQYVLSFFLVFDC